MQLDPPNLRFVKFFIDSQAAILALNTPDIRSRAVENARGAVNRLAERAVSVTLNWIPAHKGHHGNERADALAKRGCTLTSTPVLPVGKPHAAIKSDIKTGVYKSWNTKWIDSQEARHTKAFYLGPNPRKSKFVINLARLELGRFIRLITGHNNLNYFQTKIGLHNNSTCRLCGEGDETFQHFAQECPRLYQARQETFQGEIPTNTMQWSVRELIDFSYIPTINRAFEGNWEPGGATNLDRMDPIEAEDADMLSISEDSGPDN